MIDLRSDTLTQPDAAMRAAMAEAEVGDDVYGEDPTVARLERRTAALLGKEAALFVPSGTMANQIALRLQSEPGDEVLLEPGTHVANYERGGPAALSGVTLRNVPGCGGGLLDPAGLEPALRRPSRHVPADLLPPQRLLVLENTHNAGGGTVWPIAQLQAVAALAREAGMRVHLDGARLWNAAAASGVEEAAFASIADTVSVCFSKGLGAPVGSALLGDARLIARARRLRGMLGGAMRQAGILAAGALYGLERNRARLALDHREAQAFAAGLARIEGVGIAGTPPTNIVYAELGGRPAAGLVEACWGRGLRLLPVGPSRIRAVFHLDVPPGGGEAAAGLVGEAMRHG